MNQFWKGKRVLVTGHTGFVGAWMCVVLQELGAEVYGYALQEEEGALYGKIKKHLKLHNTYGDIREYADLVKCVEACKPQVVIHLAAYGFLKRCHDNPQRAYETNVNGTLNLMQALNGLHEDRMTIVVISSDKVYENKECENILFKEDDCLGGIDTYSCSKTCEDMLARSFYATYFDKERTSMVTIRPSNIIGGGDHNITRLIPSIFVSIKQGKEISLRNPDATRPWQSVLDAVDAYLTLAEKSYRDMVGNEAVYNVGPEDVNIRTVGEIAEILCEYEGNQVATCEQMIKNIKEYQYLGLSIEKIVNEIGWKPKMTIEETLHEAYDFFVKDNGEVDTYDICREQVRNYLCK